MIGYKVRSLRKEKRLSQGELATILGITQTSMSKIENGTQKVDTEMLMQIHRYFGCNLEWLLYSEEESSDDNNITVQKTAGTSPSTKEERVVVALQTVNLPQEELSKKLGLEVYAIRQMQRDGQISKQTELLFESNLGVSRKWLNGRSGDMFASENVQKKETPEKQKSLKEMLVDLDIQRFLLDQKRERLIQQLVA